MNYIDNKKIQKLFNIISLIIQIVSILFFAISRQIYLTVIIFILFIVKILIVLNKYIK